MNNLLNEMVSLGHRIGEFDYEDKYYLYYENFFKTGKYREIIVTGELVFLNKRGNLDFERRLPSQYLIVTDEDKQNPYYKWPSWTSDFNSLTKVTLVFGVEKTGYFNCLHAIIYNACNAPHNAQLDFFVNDIIEWNIKGGDVNNLLPCFKYSCGKTTINFGDSLINYCERIVSSDPSFVIFLNNFILIGMLFCDSLFKEAHLVFSNTAYKVLEITFNALDSIRKEL